MWLLTLRSRDHKAAGSTPAGGIFGQKGDPRNPMLDHTDLEDKMDDNPKTRSEKKGKGKDKDKDKDKGPYSAKHVRIAQALQESKSKPTKKP